MKPGVIGAAVNRLLVALLASAALVFGAPGAAGANITKLHLTSVTNPERSGQAITLTGTGFKVGDSIKCVMANGPTVVAKPLRHTSTKLTGKAPFAPGAGTHAWLVSVVSSRTVASNRLSVRIITGLHLSSISPALAYNCHIVFLHGTGLAGVHLVWFGSAFEKPIQTASTKVVAVVSPFAHSGDEVVAEDPNGLHSNPLIITILAGGC